MNPNSAAILAASLGALSFSLIPEASLAQTAPAAGSATTLPDIVVTARKVGEASQSLPITVSAFSGQELNKKVVLNVQDLQGVTPGLTVSNNLTGGVPIFAIRGTATELGIYGGVAVYSNDVPLITTVGIMNAFYDLSSVEVLKGPQGTQFGTNTTGGTLSVRSNLPTDRFEGYLKAGVGNFNRRELEGMVNLPVNDVLGFRLAGNWVKRDGYVKNADATGGLPKDFNDEKHYSLRGTMSLNSGPIHNDVILDYFNRDEKPVAFVPLKFAPSLLGIYLPNLGAQLGAFDTIHVGPNATGVQPEFYGRAQLFGLEERLNLELSDNLTLRNVLGYRHDHTVTSEEPSGTNTVTVNVLREDKDSQWTDDFTLRYTGLDKRLRASVGAYYSLLDQDIGINANVLQGLFTPFSFLDPTAPTHVVSTNNFESKRTQSTAVYFNTEYDITDKLGMNGGVRYNWDNVRSQVTAGSNLGAHPLGTPPIFGYDFLPTPVRPCDPNSMAGYPNFNPVTCSASREASFKAPSWLFAMTYKFTPKVLGYAKVSHGYLAGGTNFTLRDPGRTTYQPEKTTMIEGGVKADWYLFDRPIRTNVAIYRGKTDNKQVFANANYAGGGTGFGVVNAAQESVYGADFELRYSPFDGLTLDASYNVIHATFDKFIYPALGSGPSAVPASDLSGHTPAQTPANQVNVALTYAWPLDETMGKVSTTVSGYYTSKITQENQLRGYDQAIGGQFNTLSGYFLANASLNWDNVMNSPVSVQLWARNIFNKHYLTATNIQFITFGWATASYGAPQTFGASATVRF